MVIVRLMLGVVIEEVDGMMGAETMPTMTAMEGLMKLE